MGNNNLLDDLNEINEDVSKVNPLAKSIKELHKKETLKNEEEPSSDGVDFEFKAELKNVKEPEAEKFCTIAVTEKTRYLIKLASNITKKSMKQFLDDLILEIYETNKEDFIRQHKKVKKGSSHIKLE